MTILNLKFWAQLFGRFFLSLLASSASCWLLLLDAAVVDSPSILASAFLTQPFAASSRGDSIVLFYVLPKSFAPLAIGSSSVTYLACPLPVGCNLSLAAGSGTLACAEARNRESRPHTQHALRKAGDASPPPSTHQPPTHPSIIQPLYCSARTCLDLCRQHLPTNLLALLHFRIFAPALLGYCSLPNNFSSALPCHPLTPS